MHATVISSLGLFAIVFSFVLQFAGAGELSREVAVSLIADAEQVRPKEVVIGPMHEVDGLGQWNGGSRGGLCDFLFPPK